MEDQNIARKDWALAVIAVAADSGSELSPVYLQKSLFLLGEMFRDRLGGDFYQFIPHHYGPFSKQIYDDVEDLKLEGLVEFVPVPGETWVMYRATKAGVGSFEDLQKTMARPVLDYVRKMVPIILGLSFEQLVSVIYEHFSGYSVNSVFRAP